MTLRDHLDILQLAMLPIIACTIIVSLPLIVWYRISHGTLAKQNSLFVIAFALLGAVAGLCIGSSRTPVVGTVLPALLTLMTALCGYAFTKEGLKDMRPVLPFGLVALLLTSAYCAFLGSKVRIVNEQYAAEVQKQLLRYERVQLEVEKAKELQKLGIGFREPTRSTESPRP